MSSNGLQGLHSESENNKNINKKGIYRQQGEPKLVPKEWPKNLH